MTNRFSYSQNLFPSFAPPPFSTCEIACARRLSFCCAPNMCRCGRCDSCRARGSNDHLRQLRGTSLEIVDVDNCGNLIIRICRSPQYC